MSEAVFGLIGVALGSALTWIKDWWTEKEGLSKNARYLAIRVVCILDKYADQCAQVVQDDGYCMGQRNENDMLEVQVAAPSAPHYPDDIDWKSIEPKLMYSLLSLSNDVYIADRHINGAGEIASPPDFEEAFDERQFQYSILGLKALNLGKELRRKYKIPSSEEYENDLEKIFTEKKQEIEKRQNEPQPTFE